MIVLLPSAAKQAELYVVFEKLAQKPATSWASSNSKLTNSSVSVTNRLVQCQFCEQYFTREELHGHKTNHHSHESSSSTSKRGNLLESSKVEEFPALSTSFATKINLAASTNTGNNSNTKKETSSSQQAWSASEEFPALGNGLAPGAESRFSTMPTPNLFSNPSSHLSLANKKKHRLQK